MLRVLIAERGPVALRLVEAMRRLGLETVAVFSTPDAEAAHADAADYAVHLPGERAENTYGNPERLIAAAMDAGCDAFHPGLGLLAGDPDVARYVQGVGLHWIGADADVLASLRDRLALRKLARRENIPLPERSQPIRSEEQALGWVAGRVGPVTVRARMAARGAPDMLVADLSQLPYALGRTRSRAAASSGDEEIYLEDRALLARRVDVLVVADQHGNLMSIGQLDGAIQRAGMPVAYECPAAVLGNSLRSSLAESALRLGAALDFCGAGHVGFLVTPDGRFELADVGMTLPWGYPAVERTYGVDLVEAQLRMVTGERMDWEPEDVNAAGHAISVAIRALEAAPRGWLTGSFRAPEGVETQSAVVPGAPPPVERGALLLRFTVQAPTRHAAIVRARAALDEIRIDGLRSDATLHRQAMAREDYWRGLLYTGVVEESGGT